MTREEAIKIIESNCSSSGSKLREACAMFIPELVESEDEKMRKWLIGYFEKINNEIVEKDRMRIIAYLEKQKADTNYNRMAPIYSNRDSFESALDKAWKFYNDSGSSTVDGCEENAIELAFAKGFREGFLAERQKEQEPIKMEVYEVGKETTICGQDYKCKKDYKVGNCRYIKDAIYHCGRDGYLTDQNGVSWSCTPEWFNEYIQSNTEWAEEEKTRFVSGQFLQCKLSFDGFKEGEHYWLEYVGDDMYVGRSDNILNQKFHITPRQLFTLFSQELEEVQGPPQGEKQVSLNYEPPFNENPSDNEIIEALIKNLKEQDGFLTAIDCVSTKAILSWLEKQKEEEGYEAIPVESTLEYKLGFKAGKESEKQKDLTTENIYKHSRERMSFYNGQQKEQKPILEVFGFKVGDAVRLKDGDGRKHIIKSFEEIEGLHGPNFYHVEFEDDSARDSIYPNEEYPNGYYTQMEKFKEEQKSIEDVIKNITKDKESAIKFLKSAGIMDDNGELAEMYRLEQKPAEMDNEETELSYFESVLFSAFSDGWQQYLRGEEVDVAQWAKEHSAELLNAAKLESKPAEWSEGDEVKLNDVIRIIEDSGYVKSIIEHYTDFIKSLPERFNLQPKQEWSEEDEKCINSIFNDFKQDVVPDEEDQEWLRNRLKSLRPQSHWKPSEEQINALEYFIRSWGESGTMSPQNPTLCAAKSLLNDLQKLL